MRFDEVPAGARFVRSDEPAVVRQVFAKEAGRAVDERGVAVDVPADAPCDVVGCGEVSHAVWVAGDGTWTLVLRWQLPGGPGEAGGRRWSAIHEEAAVDARRADDDVGATETASGRAAGVPLVEAVPAVEPLAALERVVAAADEPGAAPLVARALARRAAGDLQGARADLDLAVARDPSFAAGWLARAGVRASLGDGAGAAADLRAFLAAAPDHPKAGIVRATLVLLEATK